MKTLIKGREIQFIIGIPDVSNFIEQIKEIFYQSSSKKDFKNNHEKEEFYYHWLGLYLESFEQLVLTSWEGDSLLGYIVGHPKTLELAQTHQFSYLGPFLSYFNDFPSHLHMNCRQDIRGLGLGGEMIQFYLKELRPKLSFGVHIITSPTSKNVSFYRRNGLTIEHKNDSKQLLFMGKSFL